MHVLRWVAVGLGAGVLGGFFGGWLRTRTTWAKQAEAERPMWAPDGPSVPIRDLPVEQRLVSGTPQTVVIGGVLLDELKVGNVLA